MGWRHTPLRADPAARSRAGRMRQVPTETKGQQRHMGARMGQDARRTHHPRVCVHDMAHGGRLVRFVSNFTGPDPSRCAEPWPSAPLPSRKRRSDSAGQDSPVSMSAPTPTLLQRLLAPLHAVYVRRLSSRLARMGLTYHDAVNETGVYDLAISRLPPSMRVRPLSACAAAGVGGRPCHGSGGGRRGPKFRWSALRCAMLTRDSSGCVAPSCQRLRAVLVVCGAQALCSPRRHPPSTSPRALPSLPHPASAGGTPAPHQAFL